MASIIMHIAVADQLYKKIKNQLNINYYDYILGSIAPDISKKINHPREKSHFIDDFNTLPNINKFLEKYHSTLNNSFNLGYYIHLYTDFLFFKDYYPLFIQEGFFNSVIKKLDGTSNKITNEEMKKILYNDYTNLNIKLIDEYQLSLDIFYNDFIKPNTNLDEIPISKLPILIKSADLIIQKLATKKEYIIDISSIKSFINDCTEEIYNQLIILNLIK